MSELLNMTFTVVIGTSWTLAYILIIVQSFRDKTYGMPFLALSFNLCWEILFSTILWDGKLAHLIIYGTWAVLDIFILAAYLRYGIKEWPRRISPNYFYPFSIMVLVGTFVFIYFLCTEIHDVGGNYMAYIQNTMMSVLFINMLNNRGNIKGQSAWIAFFKMLGTGVATLFFFMIRVKSLTTIGSLIFSFDFIYLVMVLNHGRLMWPIRLKLRA
jgi:hypothetical protein